MGISVQEGVALHRLVQEQEATAVLRITSARLEFKTKWPVLLRRSERAKEASSRATVLNAYLGTSV